MRRDRIPRDVRPASALRALVVLCVATASLLHGAAQAQLRNPDWRELSPSEQKALEPLRDQWSTIDAARKQKWIEIAARYPAMTREQQSRTGSRMAEWAAMSPAQRNAARIQFEQARQVPAAERQARWDAYQSLPSEQREAFGQQASQRPPGPAKPKPLERQANADKPPAAPRPADKPKPVGIGTVQATVGASTRPISQSPTPPRHQQPGLPKIAATPDFVDGTTLLPQRGPQGAAIEPPRAP